MTENILGDFITYMFVYLASAFLVWFVVINIIDLIKKIRDKRRKKH